VKACLSCGTTFDDHSWTCPSCGYAPTRRDGYPSFAEAEPLDGYDSDLFEQLADIEEQSFWFRGRSRLVTWALDRYFPDSRSLLEVGSGTGYMLQAFTQARPDLSVSGAELFSEGIAVARRRVPDVPIYQLDARRMPFQDEYDVAAALDVLEHVDDDLAAIAGLHRCLRPGGGLLVTVPQHPALWSPADEISQHVRRYRRRELLQKLASAGFEILRTTSFVSLLLPAMAAQRVLARRERVSYSLTQELTATARITPLLDGIMAAERALVRLGASFPAGGSLLVVARKAAS
jgi:SAM-dependent methyltransferase